MPMISGTTYLFVIFSNKRPYYGSDFKYHFIDSTLKRSLTESTDNIERQNMYTTVELFV